MARKKKNRNYKAAAAAANRRANVYKSALGRKRSGGRRRGSGGKLGMTTAGLKRAFNLQALALAAVAALGARALYGYLVDMLPDLDDKARAALAGVAPTLAAILISGNPAIVAPVAAGAAAVALADMLGDAVGDSIAESVPVPVSDALGLGIGYKGREKAAVPDPGEKPLAEPSLLVEPPPALTSTAEPLDLADDTGVGDIDFLQVSRTFGA